jgi:predicted deacetylase
MNWRVWSEVETILNHYSIKPILAVVPDNQDKMLQIDPPDSMFWEKVRRWESMGWTIALHGFQHKYVTNEKGIIGLNHYSEFAGLCAEEQEYKLRSGLGVFNREGINTDVWIAPAHSFDKTTLSILPRLGLRVISDGFYLYPNTDKFGIFWIPQQLWHFRQVWFGVWTICFHHNRWRNEEIQLFRQNVEQYQPYITDLKSIQKRYSRRKNGLLDQLTPISMRLLRWIKSLSQDR